MKFREYIRESMSFVHECVITIVFKDNRPDMDSIVIVEGDPPRFMLQELIFNIAYDEKLEDGTYRLSFDLIVTDDDYSTDNEEIFKI